MANGQELDFSILDNQQQQATNGGDESLDFSVLDSPSNKPQTRDEIESQYEYVTGDQDNWFNIVKDPNTGQYGIKVPDFNLDWARIENTPDDDPETLSTKESLINSWNNALDQISSTDEHFSQFAEVLFGDWFGGGVDSLTYKGAEAEFAEHEARAGDTIGFTDLDDKYEDEGIVAAITGGAAATINALSAFGASAIQSAATGGSGLAVSMLNSSVRDYNANKAEALGVTVEELYENGDNELFTPAALGTLAYSFERAGLKGVGKAINGLAPGAAKQLITIANAAGKEGGTEFAQSIVETYNQALGSQKSQEAAVEDVSTFIQEEGLETFLQGAVGGGLSAGGGRAIKRAASRLRGSEAERAIVENSDKILEIDRFLGDPNIPEDQKKTLRGARRTLQNELGSAIKDPNKIISRLTDDQINIVNKEGDKINKERAKLAEIENNPQASDAVLNDRIVEIAKEDANKKIEKSINKINKAIELRESKKIRQDDGVLSAPDYETRVDKAYKEGDQGKMWEYALEDYAPLINSVARELWGGETRGDKYDQFVEDITYGLDNDKTHSFIGLINDFDGRGSFGGWVKSQLKNRATRILDKTNKRQTLSTDEFEAKTGKAVEVAVEDAPIEVISGTQSRRLASRLGFDNKIHSKITDAAADTLTGGALTTKTRAGFNKDVNKAAEEKLFDAVAAQLGKDTKANPQWTKNMIKNWKKYLSVIPDIAYAQSRGETQQWAENPPTQKEFVDYFTAKDEKPSTRRQRKRSLIRWISQGLMNEAANEALQDPATAELFEAINNIGNDPKVAINSISNARIALIDKVPISESRINGVAGAVLKREDVTPSDQINAVLQQAWRGQDFNANSTTNQNFAEHFLVRNGIFANREEAANYIDGVNGFAIKKPDGEVFIYSNKDGKPQTLIHEYGHIWSDFVLSTNPQLWEQIMLEIIQERDTFFAKETMRLFNSGYYDKFGKDARTVIDGLYNASTDTQRASILRRVMSNPAKFQGTLLALDEIMAGAIEQHGKTKVEDSLGTKLSRLLNKFWDHIGKLLGKVRGKEIQDLDIQELMDLVVNDVITGKPGSSFAEMNIPVGNKMFEETAGSYREQLRESKKVPLEQDIYDAFTDLKGYLSEGRTIQEAVEKSWNKVSDRISKGDWFKKVAEALNQSTVDQAQLQEAFDAGDAVDELASLWRKAAGVDRIGKLLDARFDKGKEKNDYETENQEKFDKNLEFFNKHKDLYLEHLPKQFWRMLTAVNKKTGEASDNSMLRLEDSQALAEEAKIDSKLNWTNSDYLGKISGLDSVESTLTKKGTVKKLGIKDFIFDKSIRDITRESQEVMFEFGDAIQRLHEAGVPKSDLVVLVKSFSNTGVGEMNIFRRSAMLTGYSDGVLEGKKSVAEHNPPAGFIAFTLFQHATSSSFNEDVKQAIRDKFNYWAIEKSLDPGDTKKGVGHKWFEQNMTKGFNLLVDDPVIRYLATGGDITKIKTIDGKHLAEQYGISKTFIDEANATDSKTLAEAIANAVISKTRPVRQQLVDDIDIVLGKLKVLADEAKAVQKLDAEIQKAEEAEAKVIAEVQANIEAREADYNKKIDALIEKARKAFNLDPDRWNIHDSDWNKKAYISVPNPTPRRKYARKRTYRDTIQQEVRKYSGKEGYNQLLQDLKKDQKNFDKRLEAQVKEAWTSNLKMIPLLGFGTGFFAALGGAGVGSVLGDTDAGVLGGLGLAGVNAVYQGVRAIKSDLQKASSNKAAVKEIEALFAKDLKERRKTEVPQLFENRKEVYKAKDQQFNDIIKKAKRLGVYIEGDENLSLVEIPRILNRIKKAEAERAADPVRSEKLSVFDFDDTLYMTKNKVIITKKDGSQQILDSDKFATYKIEEGDELDFSDFDNVTDAVALPDLKKVGEALKAGDDVTILTARTMRAGDPVLKLLKKKFGKKADKIKFRGVGHSSPQAKANYVTNAIAKYGYKNVFFMDDAMKNVDAVNEAISTAGVEGGAEQAVAVEAVKEKEAKKVAAEAKKKLNEAKKRQKALKEKWEKRRKQVEDQFVTDLLKSKDKNVGNPSAALSREKGAEVDSWKILGRRFQKLKFFLGPNAEDFKGLLYTLLPKGKEGEKQWKLITQKLLVPFAQAQAAIAKKKGQAFSDLNRFIANFDKTNKKFYLSDKVPGSNKLTYEQAVRLYLHSLKDPDLRDKMKGSKKDLDLALATVRKDPTLQALAIDIQQAVGGYLDFNEDVFWGGNFKTDLNNYLNKDYRAKALKEFTNNVDRIFSGDNMNKFEAAYGTQWRHNMEDIIRRMKSGKNRQHSNNATVNRFQDWINNSVATTMMLNLRSGFLQTLSALNFINAPGNNIFRAAAAFANTPQYLSDFFHLFNSEFLKARRGGQAWDIAADEIAQLAHGKNSMQKLMAKMFQIGFTPTQMMDSFAIAAGGALWYRNARKDGMSEEQAMLEFQEMAEESQQSSRPDKISGIQASSLGRIIFAFANTPLQYARLTKRAAQDIYNRRGSDANNLAKITWYGAAQGLIFAALQNAVLAGFAGEDDEEDEELTAKNLKYGIESFIGSWLKGWGFPGAIAGTLFGAVNEIEAQQGGDKRKDAYKVAEKFLAISPTVSIKFRDIVKSYRSWTYQQEIDKMKNLPLVHRHNPMLESIFTATTALTNFSAPEVILQNINKIKDINDEQLSLIQKLAILAGYNKKWQLGVDVSQEDAREIQETIREGKRGTAKSRRQEIKEERRRQRAKGGKSARDKAREAARARRRGKSPVNKGEVGQAFNDGTIEVDPNLKGEERERTIAHEMYHANETKAGRLDYDKDSVFYRGQKFPRKNGKIKQGGKWKEEGDRSFPWEQEAYAHEEQAMQRSPFNRSTEEPTVSTPWEETASAAQPLVGEGGDEVVLGPVAAGPKEVKAITENPNITFKEGVKIDGLSDAVHNAILGTGDLGFPVVVTSGTRSAAQNAKVGGATGSAHKNATGADLRTPRGEDGKINWEQYDQLLGALINNGATGIGIYGDNDPKYTSHIHFDDGSNRTRGREAKGIDTQGGRGLWFKGDVPGWIQAKYSYWRKHGEFPDVKE